MFWNYLVNFCYFLYTFVTVIGGFCGLVFFYCWARGYIDVDFPYDDDEEED